MRLILIVALMLALAAPAQAAGRWKRLTNLAGPPLNAGHGLVVAWYGPHGVAVIGPEGVRRTYDFGPLCELRTAGGGRAWRRAPWKAPLGTSPWTWPTAP